MKSLSNYVPVNIEGEGPRVRVTLNIPRTLIPAIEARRKRDGMSMTVFLGSLLSRYGKLVSSQRYRVFLPNSQCIFTRYQNRGLDLKLDYVRVAPEDWVKLGKIALLLGSSRCLVFVHLVKLLLFGANEILKTPQLRRTYWHTLAKKGRMLRLYVNLKLDRLAMTFTREHHWEFEKL